MSFELQHKIKQNALEMKEYVSGLYEWERQMELKEMAKNKIKKQHAQNIQVSSPIIKPPPPTQVKAQPIQKKKDLIRDSNTVSSYYKAWQKFDIDKEIERLEDEETRPYRPYNPYEDTKNNLRAKPKVKVNIKGRREHISDPTQLKDKGNLHFQSLQYSKAIECYTQCIQKVKILDENEDNRKLLCVVYSNRAMTYLKINEANKAFQDCNDSLKYNDKYVKSYFRRAECERKLGKYRQSLQDYKKVKQLDPSEGKVDAEIKKIEAFLAKRCKQAREAMIINYDEKLLLDSRRIEITQVDALNERNKQANYLEEL